MNHTSIVLWRYTHIKHTQTMTSEIDRKKSMPSNQLLGDEVSHTFSLPLFLVV